MDTQGVGITQRLAPRVPENWSVAATCNLNWKCEAMSREHPPVPGHALHSRRLLSVPTHPSPITPGLPLLAPAVQAPLKCSLHQENSVCVVLQPWGQPLSPMPPPAPQSHGQGRTVDAQVGVASGDSGELLEQDFLAERVEGQVSPHVGANGSDLGRGWGR